MNESSRRPRARKQAEPSLLAEIGEELAAGDGSPEQIQRSLARGGAALGFEIVLHYEPLEAGSPRLLLVASAGLEASLLVRLRQIEGGEHVLGASLLQRKPVIEEGLDELPFRASLDFRGMGIRCCVGVPLLVSGKLIGTLAFATRTRRKARKRDLERLEAFAGQVARHIFRRRAERQLAQARGDPQSASQRTDDFLAILAHELRNPLAPIRNAVQGLRAAAPDNAAICSASDIVERQVTYLVGLVDDLLDVARIGRGKLVLKSDRIALMDVVRQAVETCRPQLAAAAHELVVTGDDACFVTGDLVRLTQVVSNLIANAAKFTAAGGRVELIVARDGDSAVLRVRDNGRGMDAATVAHVFDMFYQGAREEPGGGLGIGLALVKSIVALHRGHVEAHSEGHDRGSEFVVRLPCAAGNANGDTAAAPLERKDARRESPERPAARATLKAG